MASDADHRDVEKNEEMEMDDSKVKFINGGGKGDPDDVSVQMSKPKSVEFAGMDKEELMQFANDPFWKKARLILFIAFWVIWIAMLVAAIIIIVLAPKCPPKPDLDWYQTKPMYQIYPRSFKDTDGNGIGDLKGIESQIPYLKKLGIGSLILASVYESEDVDFGYDVTNHTAIHPLLGSMEDFESLLKVAHKNRMKVVMDFVPNHTSKKHKWFVESQKKTKGYADYYVWEGNSQGSPPSNWLSKYSKGSAWEWDASRGQFYYHTFFKEQPELNLMNAEVVKELEKILEFWVTKGVDGFRFGAMSNLVEAAPADEPKNSGTDKNPWNNMDHTLTMNQNETFNLTSQFRTLLDSWYGKGGFDQTKMMLVESLGEVDDMIYGTEEAPGAHLAFNYDLFKLKKGCDGNCLKDTIMTSAKKLPEGKWGTWLLGNHDTSRVASRIDNPVLVNVMNTLLLTLPGTPILYYGDEIGMKNIDQTFADVQDKLGKNFGATDYKEFSRDPERSPMQWTSKLEAGFSNSTPWIPLHPDYVQYNVKSVDAHGASLNYLDVVRDLIKLREQPSFLWGQIFTTTVNANIFSYVRKAEGHPAYLVAMNVGAKESSDDYVNSVKDLVTAKGEVVFSSFDHSEFENGQEVGLDNVLLRPGNVVVFKLLK